MLLYKHTQCSTFTASRSQPADVHITHVDIALIFFAAHHKQMQTLRAVGCIGYILYAAGGPPLGQVRLLRHLYTSASPLVPLCSHWYASPARGAAAMGVQEAPLPAAFPVYAFLSLLGDLLLALLLVVVHGLLLAPRCVAAWARRRRGEAGPPPEPGCEFYQGTVTHTRLWPVFHTFTYPVRARGCGASPRHCAPRLAPQTRSLKSSPLCAPLQVRNVLVDLDAPPTWFARQKVRAAAACSALH